jgi:hypothetical protein
MKSCLNITLCLALLGVLSPLKAIAHHSAAMYDFDQVTMVEGVVKDFLWVNPHVMMWVVVPARDGAAEQNWQLENTSPGRLSRYGWSKNAFKPGAKVKVEFWPLRNGKPGGFFKEATNLDTSEVFKVPEK